MLFLDLFMLLLSLAPLAVLVEFDLASDELLVLAAPVVDALAGAAGQFDEFVLRHIGYGVTGETIAYMTRKRKAYRMILGKRALIRVTAS